MKFNSIEDAFEAYHSAPEGSEAFLSAMYYIFEKMPPVFKNELSRKVQEAFPDVKPVGYDENERPCYDFGTVAQALGLKEDDVNRVMEMRGDMPSMFVPPGSVIHKVQ